MRQKEKNALPSAPLLCRPARKGTRALIVFMVLVSPRTRVVGMVMKQENLSRRYSSCMLSCSSRVSFALSYPVKSIFLVHPTKTELWFESVVSPSFYKRRQILSTNHEYTDMHNEVGRAVFETRAVLNKWVSLQDLWWTCFSTRGTRR